MEIATKILIIAISIILPGTVYLLFINHSLIEQIRKTPINLIKDLPSQGKVAFIGKAKTNTLISPITKNSCVYFNCYVQELKVFGDDHDPHRIPIYEVTSKEPLMLSDAAGSIRVDTNCAKLILRPNLQEIVTADTHPEIRTSLSEYGINITSDHASAKSYFVHEELITADEPIYILGHVRQTNGDRTIANKWNLRVIISDSNQADLIKIYNDQMTQIKKYTPVTLFTIILFLLAAMLFCNWHLP